MIRHPRRNIAESQYNRQTKAEKQVKSTELVKTAPAEITKPVEKQVEEPIYCENSKWNDILYPSHLWRAHRDLDLLMYHRKSLTLKQIEEIELRSLKNLTNLERQADDILLKFAKQTIDSMGPERYAKLIQDAMNDNSKIMLALRCYIASKGEYVSDSIEIYRNKIMNSTDFFGAHQWRTETNEETGEEVTYVDTRDEQPYERSEIVKSSKHHRVHHGLIGPRPTKRDFLPSDMANNMLAILNHYGISIASSKEAWAELDRRSKASEIEDRIISKIAYLMINANLNPKKGNGMIQRQLPGPNNRV